MEEQQKEKIFRCAGLRKEAFCELPAGITIYLSLALIIMMGLFFTLLESARVYGLEAHSRMESELLLESEMAEYHPLLFDKYHLYLLSANTNGKLDIASVEKDMWKLGNENLTGRGTVNKNTADFYEMQLGACSIESYTLVTDKEGAAYRQQAAEYMKNVIPLSVLYDLYENATQTEENAQDIDAKIERADGEVQNIENGNGSSLSKEGMMGREAETDDIDISPELMAEAEKTKNPLEEVRELKNKGILSLVINDVSKISELTIDGEDAIAERECCQGDGRVSLDISDMEEGLFFREYLLQEFGSYREPSEGTALQYAQEYFIAGKNSDIDNLTAVTERLLGIREVVNYIRIHKDTKRTALAKAMALTIGGASLNPALIAIIKEGILAAWAFTDSIEDVKTLLAGGKVPVFEGKKEWSLSYEDYLRILMYLTGEESLALRSLNYMEKDIRLAEGDKNFRMDCMISGMHISCEYLAEPLFFGLFGSGGGWDGSYSFRTDQKFSYE